MPAFNIPTLSLSTIFLAGSVALKIWFPDKTFTPDFALALFLWFFALAPLNWIHDKIDYFVGDRTDGDMVWSGIFLVFQTLLIGYGCYSFWHGLFQL